MYGNTHDKTRISPARLVKKACSSLPECFRTCPNTDTSIPTAAILKIKLIVNFLTPFIKL